MLPNGAGALREFWYDKFPPGPTHNEIPYGFKVSAIEYAKESGYESVLWLDSSVVPIASLDPVWEHIEREGYWFSQNYDYTVGQFCTDEALAIMQYTREEAQKIPLVIATAFGLDLRSSAGLQFFSWWKEYMLVGVFNGPRDTHRHDQTAASVVCHRLEMNLTQPPKFIVEDFQAPTEETVFTICR